MRNEPGPTTSRRRFWCGLVVATLLAPALAGPPSTLVAAVAAAVTTVIAMLRWPTGRISLAWAAVGAAVVSLVADLVYFGPHGLVLLWLPFEVAALLVLVGRVIRRVPDRRVVAVGIAVSVAVLLTPLRFASRAPATTTTAAAFLVLLMALPLAGALGVGLYLRSLDNRRIRAVEIARRDQRLEVARDLHDFVAHEVTGIVIEAQAARVGDYDPREAQDLLRRIEDAGLRALASMDRTVQTLRDPESGSLAEPPPTKVYGLGDLPELVERFAGTGTMRAKLDMPDTVVGALQRDADSTAYTLVLEALTNVRRHAPDTREVAVTVAPVSDEVEVIVTNDGGQGGALLGTDRAGGGTGLAGLHERVTALGGTMAAGPHERGWRVSARLPVETPRP
ncbi:sensor histidine kinase [Streptoalloteichus hindustanus]|uniref:histidine kinase n=1 Tax=Streptoalloteichus hindustanus TaxID=2017 RepID=A0A1M4XTY7_STRHI|nr:histidine kinase [Streptoalloteichus hindustanus]SHE96806.1 Signal transduction histidine kinase [Streptoalloteichus hindustanus]